MSNPVLIRILGITPEWREIDDPSSKSFASCWMSAKWTVAWDISNILISHQSCFKILNLPWLWLLKGLGFVWSLSQAMTSSVQAASDAAPNSDCSMDFSKSARAWQWSHSAYATSVILCSSVWPCEVINSLNKHLKLETYQDLSPFSSSSSQNGRLRHLDMYWVPFPLCLQQHSLYWPNCTPVLLHRSVQHKETN